MEEEHQFTQSTNLPLKNDKRYTIFRIDGRDGEGLQSYASLQLPTKKKQHSRLLMQKSEQKSLISYRDILNTKGSE